MSSKAKIIRHSEAYGLVTPSKLLCRAFIRQSIQACWAAQREIFPDITRKIARKRGYRVKKLAISWED